MFSKLLAAGSLLWLATGASAEEFFVRTDRDDALYKVGERATFRVEVSKDGIPLTQGVYSYRISCDNGETLQTGKIDLAAGNPALLTFSLNRPGFARLSLTDKLNVENKNLPKGFSADSCGAAFSPEMLRPSVPYPADFREFWDRARQKAEKEGKMTLTPVPELDTPDVLVFRLAVETPWGRSWGFLAKPRAAGKYPALVTFPGSGPGVSGPDRVLAARGVITFNMNAHDYEVPMNDAEARAVFEKHRAEITQTINQAVDPETFYFRRVILNTDRAVDWIAAMPEWDGKHLVFTGSSQGGQLCFAIAGLNPHLSAFAANVPDYCDTFGQLDGRSPNSDAIRIRKAVGNRSDAVLPYFDSANFARSIRCAALVSCGFVDSSCPPGGVYAAFNMLECPKQLVPMPGYTHSVPELYKKIQKPWVEKQLGL